MGQSYYLLEKVEKMLDKLMHSQDVFELKVIDDIEKEISRIPFYFNHNLKSKILDAFSSNPTMHGGKTSHDAVNMPDQIGRYLVGQFSEKNNIPMYNITNLETSLFFTATSDEKHRLVKESSNKYSLFYFVNSTGIIVNVNYDKIIDVSRGDFLLIPNMAMSEIKLPEQVYPHCIVVAEMEIAGW
jgi:hypothetical protein